MWQLLHLPLHYVLPVFTIEGEDDIVAVGGAPVLPPVVEPLQVMGSIGAAVNAIALDRAPIIGVLEGMAARQPLLSRPKLPCWRKFQEFFRRIVRSTIFRDYFDMVSSTRGLASVVENFDEIHSVVLLSLLFTVQVLVKLENFDKIFSVEEA